jgi:ABC-type lipoprotein release transport system permease subunit
MKTTTLIRRNLVYYWRTNAAVVAGVGVAVAVLAGELVVGDSVRASLRELFLGRLGKTEAVVSATGFFRERLADDLLANGKFRDAGFDAACPIVALGGVVTHEEGRGRASEVAVYGVDERFWKFHGTQVAAIGERDVLLSRSLADELGAKAGDVVLVRVEKPSAIPVESLHGRKDDVGRTVRLTVREVLTAPRLGEFSLRPAQGEVRAAFLSLARLQKETGQGGQANAILLSGAKPEDDPAGAARRRDLAEQALRETFALADLGAKVRVLDEQHALSLESDGALISDELSTAARATAAKSNLEAVGVYSYLANAIRANGREVPYSLMTAIEDGEFNALASRGLDVVGALPHDERFNSRAPETRADPLPVPPIILNEWAADDLAAKIGDEVTLDYYLWREEGRLSTETARFSVVDVVPVSGLAADRNLTPEYPGISGAESLSDWDPPFPVELSRVRKKDEDYWHEYRTTPKAFIPLAEGQRLWGTRFGKLTSLRLYPPPVAQPDSPGGAQLEAARAEFERNLRASIDPVRAGFTVASARAEGLRASLGATDFGEYFLYFSFFVVASALLLASLFFKLGVEQRAREIGLLRASGFPASKVRALFLAEGVTLACVGSLLGVAGALLYAALMMWGLRTFWVGAVGTRQLALHASPASLVIGFAGGIAAAALCVWWTLRALSRVSARRLLAGSLEADEAETRRGWGLRRGKFARESGATNSTTPRRARVRTTLIVGLALCGCGIALVALAALKGVGETAGFFGAGVLLLAGLLCLESAWLRGGGRRTISGRGWWAVARLGLRNAAHRPARSVLCVALVASSAFIIVAIDAFRQRGVEDSANKHSGGGGYPLAAQSLLPVAHDPNTPEGREALNLNVTNLTGDNNSLAGVHFARFRVRAGDDASCLNLYQPREPRLLGATSDFLRENRFAFASSLAASAAEKSNPWLLLEKDGGDVTIPVAADANSLAYVLHKKLGDVIEVRGDDGSPVRLRFVAALSDSIFQSELLMAEKNFLRSFPKVQGYRFFLIDAPAARSQSIAARLEEQLSDYGFDAVAVADRLAAFHRVENTYISTFQALGGLGTVLGTLGLAAVLLRNVLERRRELALLRAVGYDRTDFALMIVAENALLLLAGVATGAICAAIAVAPALLQRGVASSSHATLALLLLAVLAAGLLASLAATAAALRAPLLQSLRAG